MREGKGVRIESFWHAVREGRKDGEREGRKQGGKEGGREGEDAPWPGWLLPPP